MVAFCVFTSRKVGSGFFTSKSLFDSKCLIESWKGRGKGWGGEARAGTAWEKVTWRTLLRQPFSFRQIGSDMASQLTVNGLVRGPSSTTVEPEKNEHTLPRSKNTRRVDF